MGGVDGFLVDRQPPPTLAGVGIAPWATVRDFDIPASSAVSAVGDNPDPGSGQGLDETVFAGRAHVVPGTGRHR